jgi:bifunctional oligoribonuclease and PAP phosphatase NrnA
MGLAPPSRPSAARPTGDEGAGSHAGSLVNMSATDLLAVPETRRGPLAEIVRRARAARRIVLTTHVNADGDGAGSEAAIAGWLESRGARVSIVNPTPFPPNFGFLLHRADLPIELGDPRAEQAIREADLALVLDTSERDRIRPLDGMLRHVPTLVVDHHPPGPSVVGEGGVQDPTAAAAGELVYDMISLSGDDWVESAVLGVYVAIVTDTGSFRFGNTTPRAHAIAADLLSRGIDTEAVYQRLFATAPLRRLETLREALARLGHEPETGISWIALPRDVTDRLGSTAEDFDGLIEHARSIAGTRVALLFRETGPAETKVSLRSSGEADVNAIARHFGGGGHVKASGATLDASLADAVAAVLEKVRRELRRTGYPR